ncbi:hypothetical protein KCA24_16240 [Escherichia coli]|nr:hypothetical protein [Escherichia coli]
MGITSAGMQSRDAECGERIFTRTVRQVKQQTTVLYFESPPRPPVKPTPQAKTRLQPRVGGTQRKKDRGLLFNTPAPF